MSGTFEFIEAYQIIGIGCVITGTVSSGSIGIGDTATIVDRKVKVLSIERHHEQVSIANAGDNIGMQLAFVRAKDIAAAKGESVEFSSDGSKRAPNAPQPQAGSERGAPKPEGIFSIFRKRRT